MSGKECKPRSDVVCYGIWSRSTLFVQTCLYEYLGLNMNTSIFKQCLSWDPSFHQASCYEYCIYPKYMDWKAWANSVDLKEPLDIGLKCLPFRNSILGHIHTTYLIWINLIQIRLIQINFDLHQIAFTLGLIWCGSRWSTPSCFHTMGQLDPDQVDPDQVDADQIYIAAMWTQ